MACRPEVMASWLQALRLDGKRCEKKLQDAKWKGLERKSRELVLDW